MYKIYFWDRTEQGAEVIVEHKPNEDFSRGSNPCDAGVAVLPWQHSAAGDLSAMAAQSQECQICVLGPEKAFPRPPHCKMGSTTSTLLLKGEGTDQLRSTAVPGQRDRQQQAEGWGPLLGPALPSSRSLSARCQSCPRRGQRHWGRTAWRSTCTAPSTPPSVPVGSCGVAAVTAAKQDEGRET